MVGQARVCHGCRCEHCRQAPQNEIAHQHQAINRTLVLFDERRRRLFAGLLASQYGHGGVVLVGQITGLSRTTIRRGILEVRRASSDRSGRVRRPGGGRKRVEKKLPGWSQP
jgi:hypothetical protein